MTSNDRVAVVTGGTGSLGHVVVRELLRTGFQVIVSYRREALLKELQAFVGPLGSKLTSFDADVSIEKGAEDLFRRAIETHGRVDVLLNIAGAYRGGKEIQETSTDDWDMMMNVNLKTAFLCCRAVIPQMIKQNRGSIVNVAARPAVEKRYRVKSGAYAVSKAGVAVLTETIAEELKKFDINVNAIMPSTIDTPDNRKNMPQADFSKWVSPEEIAKVIMWLISEESRVTSGALIPVYGKA